MDSHFLEFWAAVLKNAAQNQRLLEETAKWLKNGFSGSEDLAALFLSTYGLKKEKKPSDFVLQYPEAVRTFRTSPAHRT